mgnify:CR=1 FL=1
MDYSGDTFETEWKDSILFLQVHTFDNDLFGLLGVIIDAAEKQGPYRVLWDFRTMAHPGYMKIPRIVYKATQLYSTMKGVEKNSILCPRKYYNFTNSIIGTLGTSDMFYVGENPIEGRQFLL